MREFFRRGDHLIWLAGGALALLLLITAAGFLFVVVRGADAFWVHDLEEYRLHSGALLLGRLRAAERGPDGRLWLEIWKGNRDLDGRDETWIDGAQLVERTRPVHAVVVERLDAGPFVGWVEEVRHGDKVVAAGRVRAPKVLAAEVEEARRRRRRIAALAEGGGGAEARAELERLLGEEQAWSATLVTDGGTRLELPLSEIARVVQPNALGPAGRLGAFLTGVYTFLTTGPRGGNTAGGILPALFGTALMTLLMSLFAIPVGLLTGIYLHEYAGDSALARLTRTAVLNLAGVPSIVYGVFGLAFLIYGVGGRIDAWLFDDTLPAPTFGTGSILWASLTLALLTVPAVVVATEEALRAVPSTLREAAFAAGATRLEVLARVTLPVASPSLVTGTILALTRAAGEVAPLMLTGVVRLAPKLPLDGEFPFLHPSRKFMHLGFHLYDLAFRSPSVETTLPLAYATAAVLLLLVFALNTLAFALRRRLTPKKAPLMP